MKSEEKSIQAISAQAHSEAADNRLLRKKLQARDKRVVELEAMVSSKRPKTDLVIWKRWCNFVASNFKRK